MKQYKNNVDRPVGAILSLNTIAHTIGSAGVCRVDEAFGEEYFGIISAILTLLIPFAFRNNPEAIGCLILAFARNAINQNHQGAPFS